MAAAETGHRPWRVCALQTIRYYPSEGEIVVNDRADLDRSVFVIVCARERQRRSRLSGACEARGGRTSCGISMRSPLKTLPLLTHSEIVMSCGGSPIWTGRQWPASVFVMPEESYQAASSAPLLFKSWRFPNERLAEPGGTE